MALSQVLAGLLICCAAGVAEERQDLTGWSKSRWGMSEAELVSAFEGEPVPTPGREPVTTTCPLWIPEVEIQGNKYSARFSFKEHRLTAVQLSPAESTQPAPFSTLFAQLDEMLRSKYGTPGQRRADSASGLADQRDSRWLFPSTTIWLTFIEPINRRFIESLRRQGLPTGAHLVLLYTAAARDADKI